MRLLGILTVAILLASAGCRKVDDDNVSDKVEKMIGRWEWVSSKGGVSGGTITPLTEGYTLGIEFDGLNYWRYKNDLVLQSGTYGAVRKKSLNFNRTTDFILYDDNTEEMLWQVTANDLTLKEDFADGYEDLYVRSN